MIVNVVNNNLDFSMKSCNTYFMCAEHYKVSNTNKTNSNQQKAIFKDKKKLSIKNLALSALSICTIIGGIVGVSRLNNANKFKTLSKRLTAESKAELDKVIKKYHGRTKRKIISELAKNKEITKKTPENIEDFVKQIANEIKFDLNCEDGFWGNFGDIADDIFTGLIIFD